MVQDRSGLAVNEHRAGSALPDPAAVLGPGQLEVVPDHPEQRGVRGHVHLDLLPFTLSAVSCVCPLSLRFYGLDGGVLTSIEWFPFFGVDRACVRPANPLN